jgi:hypothetical protein
MQASIIDGALKKLNTPAKHVVEHARSLLTTALLCTNTPPTFLETPFFKQYVQLVSEGKHAAPSRYLHLQTIKKLAAECHAVIKRCLDRSVSISIEEDAWTGDGRKFTAVTAGTVLKRLYGHRLHSLSASRTGWPEKF